MQTAPTSPPASSQSRWAARLSFGLLIGSVLLALGLRMYAIDRLPGINGDEPQYAVHAHAFFEGAALGSLRTGSGLLMNPVFFGTVLLLQKSLPATLWSLRLAAALLSVLTVVLARALFRSHGRTFAAMFACCVAVLPIHLGYARFAWDPTAIPLASVLALAAAARLRVGWTLLAWGLGLWVHPTSVFLTPLLLAPFVAQLQLQGVWWERLRRPSRRLLLSLAALVPLTAAMWWSLERELLPGAVLQALRGGLAQHMLERARQPAQLGDFVLGYIDLMSGPTIYRYIVGSISARALTLHRVASGLVLVPLLAAGLPALWRARRRRDLAFAVGLGLSLVVEYLFAGPLAIAPKTERYAVCLTVPGCYVLSACADVLATSALRRQLLRAAVGGVGLLLLGAFSTCYLAGLRRPDPQRENTFRTGPVEPKLAALQAIMGRRDPARTTLVYVEDWWIYWTVRYLAPPSTGLRVTIYKHAWDYRFPRDFTPPRYDPATMERFGVAWADDALDRFFATHASEHAEIFGYEPGPILRVHKL